MIDENPFGLIKFFRDPEKLEALREGLFYCNTPEFYRLSGDEGVSDLHESCSHAYRKERGDMPVTLSYGGHEVGGIIALTLHSSGIGDHWLHCWFKITMPKNDQDLKQLSIDIERMRKEFGAEYAFIPGNHLPELLNRLKTATDHRILFEPVKYSSKKLDWSAVCKSEHYSYQREYRFLIGECQHDVVAPLTIQYEGGFFDLISRSPELTMTDQESGHVWFHLNSDGCVVST